MTCPDSGKAHQAMTRLRRGLVEGILGGPVKRCRNLCRSGSDRAIYRSVRASGSLIVTLMADKFYHRDACNP